MALETLDWIPLKTRDCSSLVSFLSERGMTKVPGEPGLGVATEDLPGGNKSVNAINKWDSVCYIVINNYITMLTQEPLVLTV